jgi:hypothetical protein
VCVYLKKEPNINNICILVISIGGKKQMMILINSSKLGDETRDKISHNLLIR